MSQELSIRVAELCNQTFNRLPQSCKPTPGQWSNMACVVMETGTELNVTSMATGTKCLSEEKNSSWLVGDSHAEILAVKLFRVFLLDEVKKTMDDNSSAVVRQCGDKYTVKQGIRFHFYTSSVMCGDATITTELSADSTNLKSQPCPSDTFLENTSTPGGEGGCSNKPAAKRRKVAVTRTGAKSLLSDDIFLDNIKSRYWSETGGLRTKPGRGGPTLSLSCSDKIMKYIWLGAEGGLLSPFFQHSLFFSSVVISGKCDLNSVQRALIQRVLNLKCKNVSNTQIFKVPDSFMYSKENSKSNKASNMSLLWLQNNFWCSVGGKCQGGTKSTPSHKVMLPICRRALLDKILPLLQQKTVVKIDGHLRTSCDVFHLSESQFIKIYCNLKENAGYTVKKEAFMSEFSGWKEKKSAKTREIFADK